MHVASDFRTALGALDLDQLERSRNTTYGLRADLTIAYCNAGWDAFATDNGAPELSGACVDRCSVLDVILAPVRDFYRELFERVLAQKVPEEHEYACHSPELHRWFRMRVTPLPGGGLLVDHREVICRPQAVEAHASDPASYVAPDGFARQCCHCRSVQRVGAPDTWDWVPAYLDRGRRDVSHGLCPVCFAHYYPAAARRRLEHLARGE